MGLSLTKQHPCVGKENGDGFSSEYVLMSFQNLTPPRVSLKLTALSESRRCQLQSQTGEKYPPYKGAWLKIDYSQKERDEPEYHEPPISSQAAIPLRPCPLNLVRRLSLESNLWPLMILVTVLSCTPVGGGGTGS